MNNNSQLAPVVPNDRRARHREEDRRILLAAAEQVFARRGFQKTSIHEIANTAGFSVGGVYQFCQSKADLYLQVVDDQWTQYFTALSTTAEARSFLDRLTRTTRATLEYFAARREFFRMFLADRPHFTGNLRTTVARSVEHHQQQLKQHVAMLMQTGISEGVLRDVTPDRLVCAYLAILHGVLLDALSGDAPQRQPQSDAILAMFLCGAAHREQYVQLCAAFHL